jgi:O-methyltransferase domain
LRHHPEETAQFLVTDRVLVDFLDGHPGARIELQPGPSVDTDRAMRDGDGLAAERVAIRPAPRQADQGRRLLLVEAIIPDDDSPHLAKDLDIRVVTILPGGERTESEYARLLAGAGFRPQPAAGLARVESVMVGVPAGR